MQPLGELVGIVDAPEVHEEQPRLVGQHMVVDGRHLDAVLTQRAQHRVHLIGGQHEVAGRGRLAAVQRLEVDGNARCPWPGHLHATVLTVSARGIENW